jgi:hypothetical protein
VCECVQGHGFVSRRVVLYVLTRPSLLFPSFQLCNDEWGVLFKLISANSCSSSPTVGGYAAVKSFEALAWLLHEPRLRAEVPLVCVRYVCGGACV